MAILLSAAHLLAVAIGVGAGVSSVVVLWHAARAEGERAAALRGVVPVLGWLPAGAILVLWATGIPLAHMQLAAGATLGPWFAAKIAVAVLLTLVILSSRILLWRLARGADPGLRRHLPMLVRTAAALGLTAIALAAVAFA